MCARLRRLFSRQCEAKLDEYHPKATRTLFIGNLDKDVKQTELRKAFEKFGEIIVSTRAPGRGCGKGRGSRVAGEAVRRMWLERAVNCTTLSTGLPLRRTVLLGVISPVLLRKTAALLRQDGVEAEGATPLTRPADSDAGVRDRGLLLHPVPSLDPGT